MDCSDCKNNPTHTWTVEFHSKLVSRQLVMKTKTISSDLDSILCAPEDAVAGPESRPRFESPVKQGRSEWVWSHVAVVLGIHALAALALVPWFFSWTGCHPDHLGSVRFWHTGHQPLLSPALDAPQLRGAEVVGACVRRSWSVLSAGLAGALGSDAPAAPSVL